MELMPHDVAGVELGGEKTVTPRRGQSRTTRTHHPAVSDGRQQCQRRQHDAGAGQRGAAIRRIRKQSARRAVHQRVAMASGRLLIPVVRADEFSAGQEFDLDEIHESPADHLQPRAVGPASEQGPVAAFEEGAVAARQPPAVRLPIVK